MGKIEKNTEKRLFTTYGIQQEITKKIVEVPGIKWQIQQYNYYYIVHKIIEHSTRNIDNNRGCPINEKYLSKLFGKPNQQTAKILTNLVDWEVIYITEPANRKEKKSARYALNPKHDKNYIIMNVSVSDANFICKLLLHEKDIYTDKFLTKSKNILRSHLTINDKGLTYLTNKYNINKINKPILPLHGYEDVKSAFLILKNHFLEEKTIGKITGGYGLERRDIPLYLILIREFYCTRPLDKNGNESRVYNNLTNLPREHRKYVDFSGKPMLMTDISNSQILLTVPLIEKQYKIHSGKGAIDMPEDILKFKEWAESGLFYEKFGQLLIPQKLSADQRIELKKMVFRAVWFGANSRYFPKLKAIFRKNFPNVFKIITDLKIGDHAQFSIGLQRFEASIMIDIVAKKMLIKTPVLTLHDAIVCGNESVLQDAENRITAGFAKHGIKPKFKREDESRFNAQVSRIAKDTVDNESILNLKSNRKSLFQPLKKRIY